MTQRIVITEFMDIDAVRYLRDSFDTLYDPTLVDCPDRLMVEVADADALIVRNRTQVRGALLDACKNVQIIGRLGVGLDNIDTAACEARGIRVIPASGANSVAVAEYVIGTAMALLRGAYHSSAEVADGAWPRPLLSKGREICGKTLGLVGFGGIGRLTARLAQALGMTVIAHDPMLSNNDATWQQTGVRPVPLLDLLAEADVVSLHVPLTPQTLGLISAERIAVMKAGAVMINSARGGIIDEPALAAAIRSGALGGAAIDVFEHEPLKAHSCWIGCPNVILTPHVAGVTTEANVRVSNLIASEIAKQLGA